MTDQQEPRTDNQSKTSQPQSPGASEEGVTIRSAAGTGKAGVERISKHEPGALETRIEIGGGDTSQLDGDGRRVHR